MTITVTETGETAIVDVLGVDFQPETSVTEHPVELGAVVSDHVQIRPYRFSVEAFVSDAPRVTSLVTLRNTRQATSFFEGAALGKLCTVVLTDEGTFTSYVLEACPHRRDGARGGRSYSLRFRQLRIASAISVPLPPRLPAPVANVEQPDGQDLGQQATTPVDVTSESTAYAAAAALAGLL